MLFLKSRALVSASADASVVASVVVYYGAAIRTRRALNRASPRGRETACRKSDLHFAVSRDVLQRDRVAKLFNRTYACKDSAVAAPSVSARDGVEEHSVIAASRIVLEARVEDRDGETTSCGVDRCVRGRAGDGGCADREATA